MSFLLPKNYHIILSVGVINKYQTLFWYPLDGPDCRQEQGYDDMKGLVGTSWIGEDMCHEYSNCEYDDKSEMFKCRCKEGYQGDGHNCQIEKGF